MALRSKGQKLIHGDRAISAESGLDPHPWLESQRFATRRFFFLALISKWVSNMLTTVRTAYVSERVTLGTWRRKWRSLRWEEKKRPWNQEGHWGTFCGQTKFCIPDVWFFWEASAKTEKHCRRQPATWRRLLLMFWNEWRFRINLLLLWSQVTALLEAWMKFGKLILHILWVLNAVHTASLMLITVSANAGGICFMMISITDNCYTRNHTSAACKPEQDMNTSCWRPRAAQDMLLI